MKKQTYIVSVLILLLIPLLVDAQEYKVSNDSKVTIEGTSTMHDWESNVEQVSGKGTFTIDAAEVKAIKNLNVNFVVESIESGKSKMDDLTYEALKSEQHPTITFNLTEITGIGGNTINAKGQLSIAGKTNTVPVKGTAKVNGNTITINGEYPLNMTDYDIDPPTAMLGAIKVGETVTIKYNLVLTN
jgi:polyisoprenoid-binding protein YceI